MMTNYDIIYIAGYGRSGSTLLDVMLSSHPETLGTGEFTRLFRETSLDAFCTCGSKLIDCVFWSDLLNNLHCNNLHDWQKNEIVTRKCERYFAFNRPITEYQLLWNNVFKRLNQTHTKKLIIDSSKSTRKNIYRIQRLRYIGKRIFVIHLIRDPKRILASLKKGTNAALAQGNNGNSHLVVIRGMVGWLTVNWALERQLANNQNDSMHLRYEDLIEQPIKVFKEIEQKTGLDAAPIIENIKKNMFPPGHAISGNRMRQSPDPIQLKPLERISDNFNFIEKLLLLSCKPLSKKYGY